MNWYHNSKTAKKNGGNISVKNTDFWSRESKLEEVYQNIVNQRFSHSQDKMPIVTKSLEIPNSVFIMDGHHRIMEGMLKGQKIFNVYWNPDYPYLDAGINNELPIDKIKVVDFLMKMQSHVS